MRQRSMVIENALYEHFHATPASFLTMQAGFDDAGVVEYQQVACRQERRQFREHMILEFASITVQRQQPTGAAFFGRDLGDQLVGKMEIEICSAHKVQCLL